MSDYRKRLGAFGENAAARYLEQKGYRIIERNFRRRKGEIDIIAKTGGCLVFVEVRTKKGNDFGSPEESLTRSKKERLATLVDAYLQTCSELPPSWRIDVIAIEVGADSKVQRMEHIENAV